MNYRKSDMKSSNLLPFSLLLAAAIIAVLALESSYFLLKAGTATIGIVIIVILQLKLNFKSKDSWWIGAAFLFSILGDWHLTFMNDDASMFVKGIGLYFVAHIGYLVFGTLNGRINWKFTVGLLAILLLYYLLMLYPSIDDKMLAFATLLYLLISCLSLGAAIGIKHPPVVKWSFAFGIFLILFSDTIISIKDFLGLDEVEFLILPTYYLAHISITYSVIKKQGNIE
jgi:uncharacterized membrane protein YhhN